MKKPGFVKSRQTRILNRIWNTVVGISKKLNYLSILKKDFADAAAVSRIEGEVAGGGGVC